MTFAKGFKRSWHLLNSSAEVLDYLCHSMNRITLASVRGW